MNLRPLAKPATPAPAGPPAAAVAPLPEDRLVPAAAPVRTPQQPAPPLPQGHSDATVRKLEMLARSLGKDFKLQLSPGEAWGYDPATNQITYPLQAMRAGNDAYNMGVVCRELSRKLYSRLPSRKVLDNDAYAYFANAVDEIRTNAVMAQRYAGVGGFQRALYEGGALDGPPDAPPSRAHAFAQALMEGAARKVDPATLVHDPDIQAALREVAPAVQRATALPKNLDLRFDDLTRHEADAAAARCMRVTRQELWPVFERLLRQDMQMPPMDGGVGGEDEAPETKGPEGPQGGDGEATPNPHETGEGQPPDGSGQAGEGPDPRQEADGKDGDDAANGAAGPKPQESQPQESQPQEGQPQEGQPSPGEGAQGAERAVHNTPPGAQGEAEGTAGNDAAHDLDDLPEVPRDPLKPVKDTQRSAYEETLRKLFRRAARHLESKLVHAPEPTVSAAAMQHRKGTVGYNGKAEAVLEDRIKELETELRTLTPTNNSLAQGSYGDLKRRYQPAIDRMVAEIGNALQREDLPDLHGHFRTGVYDLRRAIQAEFARRATGVRDPNLFLRREEPEDRSTAIVFCIDISGSMSGPNIAAARAAFVVFQEALSELGVPYGVIAYHQNAFVLADMEKQDLTRREQNLARLVAGGGNNEVAAMGLARTMLENHNANNKLVFFLTDGGAVGDCRDNVLKIEKETDVKIIGIGIGAGCGEVPHIYPRHLQVPTVGDLAMRIGDLLVESLIT